MSFTALDMLTVRKEMTRLGFPDDIIRDTIRARMRPRKHVIPDRVSNPIREPKPVGNSPVSVGPQARVDRTVVGGYRMGPTFCGICADHHPVGEHTL
jgi:hypothetical protein